MTAKLEIMERLGEKAVLLPSLLAAGLAANDRIKLGLTLMQEAVLQAHSPGRKPNLMIAERRAVGLGDGQYDNLVAGVQDVGQDRLIMPGVHHLLQQLGDDLGAMLAPVEAGAAEEGAALRQRLATIVENLPAVESDHLAIDDVKAITSARRNGRDSVHLLTMDLHKAINRLSVEAAGEVLDGARAYCVEAADRPRILAFMRGLNRTAPLAFGHPGLGTTAVRSGERLTIQNDIGTTDAHVLVIHIDGAAVTITYTDVHRPRAKFFMTLFADRQVAWSKLDEQASAGLGEEDVFYMLTGRFEAPGQSALEDFLAFLGSRIVFLIDWNKARKALQTFVGKGVAIDLLIWAAQHDYGHRGFLELGGIDLVFEAVGRTAAGRIPYGMRLDRALGEFECQEFLRHVLHESSTGLSAGRTARLIRDEIQADLAQRFETAESAVLTVLVRHLGLSRMLAGAIAAAISTPASMTAADRHALARQSKRLEEKADRLTVQAREIAARVRETGKLRPVIDEVENAADAFDECAFLLSLLPEPNAMQALAPLADLADIAVDSVGQMVRAIEAASLLPLGQRSDAVDSLQAIDAVVNAEKRADQAARATFAALMSVPAADARALTIGIEMTRQIETATDYLSHGALTLRDRVLEELSA
ncbi:MAG TPA: hypothetical protein VM639_21530 [Dongiaceae bacterium]|nr:hypothetical protein [Dongiaceae bacterium]